MPDAERVAPEPVDWALAERVSHRLGGHDPLADSYHRDSLVTDFAQATERACDLVATFTGLDPAITAARGEVLDRGAWASANLASFRLLLSPLTERLAERVARNPVAGIGRRVAGVEAGALLGWFSRRVLGQYDPLAAERRSTVVYVGPNVLGLEKAHGFRPRDFRMWIALHEVTHLVQFTGVPWLRDHFLALVDETLSLVDPDPQRLVQAVRSFLDDLRSGRNPLEGGGLLTLLASEEQRDVMRRVQALMALLEGHGNFVMDRLGAEHVEGQERMSRTLRERRARRGLAGGMQKALGIELKLRQYAIGERFLAEVEDRAGRDALTALWEGPDALPTLQELHAPQEWVDRIGVIAAP